MNQISSLIRSALLIVGLFVVIGTSQAQPRGGLPGGGTLSGTIVDVQSGKGLSRASVAVRNASDSSLVTGAITEPNGSFSIVGVRPGRFYLRISYVGYMPKIVPDVRIAPGSAEVDLGRIAIAIDTTKNEVVVNAERGFMTNEIDRTVYMTRDILVSNGGSAIDVLKNIPSVEVDIDGKVSLRGNQNVVIMVNGRPTILSGQSLTSFLESLPAGAIERIEVIPNPSAKYDPDGMSGILNIILTQQGGRGLSGGVNASAGTPGSYSIGGNIGYGEGPWSILANYGLNINKRNGSGNRFQENRVFTPSTFLGQTSTEVNNSLGNVFSGSVDYSLDKSNTISFQTMLSQRGRRETGLNIYTNLDSLRAPLSRHDRSTLDTNSDWGMDHRLSYRWVKEAARNEITAELRYNGNWDEERGNYTERDVALDGTPENTLPKLQHTKQNDKNYSIAFQTDYLQPVGEGGRFEAGYKGELQTINSDLFSESFDNTSSSFLPDTNYNNIFSFDLTTHSAYVNFVQEWGNFGAQAGLRAEQATTKFDLKTTDSSYDNSYFSLFPSAFVTWKPIEDLQFKTSYSRRINRPRTHSLNPFGDLSDPLFRRVGNPYLKPEYIDAYEFSVTYYTPATVLTLTPYFRRTNDVIRHYSRVDSFGVTTLTNENFDKSDSWGGDLVGMLRLGSRFSATANFSAYRIITDGSNVETGLSNDSYGWNMRASTTVGLVEDMLDLQLSYNYRAPIDIEGGRIGAFESADAALQAKLLENRARVGLRISDLFDTMGFNIVRSDSRFTQEFQRRWDSRNVVLSFSYTFGTPEKSNQKRGGQRPGGDFDPGDME